MKLTETIRETAKFGSNIPSFKTFILSKAKRLKINIDVFDTFEAILSALKLTCFRRMTTERKLFLFRVCKSNFQLCIALAYARCIKSNRSAY